MSAIDDLRRELAELRAEFDEYRKQMAAEVRTGRLVVGNGDNTAGTTIEAGDVRVVHVGDGCASSVRLTANTHAAVVEASLTVDERLRVVDDVEHLDSHYHATLYAGDEQEPGDASVRLSARGENKWVEVTDAATLTMAKTIEMFKDSTPLQLAEMLRAWHCRP